MTLLKSLESEDLPHLHLIQGDLDMKKLTQGYLFPHALESTRDWFASIVNPGSLPKTLYWAIKENGTFLGYCNLHNIDWINRHAEVGIIVIEPSRGYGIRALQELGNIAFLTYGFRKIYAKVLDCNEAAIALFNKNGFELEGRLIADHYFNGIWVDNLIYSKFSKGRF